MKTSYFVIISILMLRMCNAFFGSLGIGVISTAFSLTPTQAFILCLVLLGLMGLSARRIIPIKISPPILGGPDFGIIFQAIDTKLHLLVNLIQGKSDDIYDSFQSFLNQFSLSSQSQIDSFEENNGTIVELDEVKPLEELSAIHADDNEDKTQELAESVFKVVESLNKTAAIIER